MSSLICPECRKEMLPQMDYDRAICDHCGKNIYEPSKNLKKIYCKNCDESDPGKKIHVFTE